MTKRLISLLQDKFKDFGLSEKAIEDLAAAGIEGLNDESTDEDFENKANSLVPIAKLMQAEVTRKMQRKSTAERTSESRKVDVAAGGDEEPAWFKAYKQQQEERMTELKSQNEQLRAERMKAERGNSIAAKGKELGIPDFLMKRLHLPDDADVDKELTAYKQELITNNLMPQEKADILTSSKEAAKDDAKSWASSLPNN